MPTPMKVPVCRCASHLWGGYLNDRNMIITKAVFEQLTEQAKALSRLRMNFDLRNSPDDQPQCMLNGVWEPLGEEDILAL